MEENRIEETKLNNDGFDEEIEPPVESDTPPYVEELPEEVKLKSVYFVLQHLTNYVTGLTNEPADNTVYYADVPQDVDLDELANRLEITKRKLVWDGNSLVEPTQTVEQLDAIALKAELEAVKTALTARMNAEREEYLGYITDILEGQ